MHSASDILVTAKNLSFAHQGRRIFDKINLAIHRGKVTTIMGPSGTGKTTLLRLITGQLTPCSGSVTVAGIELCRLGLHDLYKARRQIGMLFQSGALFTNLNVFENVAFPLREHTNLSEEMIKDLVLMKLQAVGLRGAYDLMTNELSGGMARRVAMARALMLDPQLMLYDEPFAGQDPITMGMLVQLIKKLNQALGLTSVIVSHDVQEAASISDYIYVLSDGKIIGEGTPEELFSNTTPAVEQFSKGLPDGVIPFHYPAKDYAEDLL